MEIKIVCENEKYLPQYANDTDACMDLQICVPISDSIKFSQGDNTIVIQPNEVRVIGTGIKVAIPEDYVMLLFPRSSTGIKLHCQLANTVGVIDAGYRDEVKLALHNFGEEPLTLVDGQRVAQFLVIPRPKLSCNVVPDDVEFRNGDRGGGIGSTGV
jgi:dUTP pyrophosphatase